MTLHWVEIGGPSTFTQGGTPIPATIASFALAPPSVLNLMKAEINRGLVLTNEAVIPLPIEVPRRQYIDFHADLFPPVPLRGTSFSEFIRATKIDSLSLYSTRSRCQGVEGRWRCYR